MSADPSDGSGPSDAGVDLAAGFLVGGGRYTLVRQIAPGGMGVVWLAQDERLNESVALKFLTAAVRNNPVELARLRQETQKSRKLTHPNIVRIYDLYEAPGELAFISMEYVDGPNLWELMTQQPDGVLAWSRLKPIVKQLCDALACAHAERVIHRDLKPTNLVLAGNDRLKLADFGLAAVAPQVDPASVERHFGGGTVTHMSPQQLEGRPASVADDIYSLGATFYDLMCGRPPFYEGNIANQVLHQPAPPVQERLAALKTPNDVPSEVAAMIMACLAKDPSKRPQSALAVAEWIGLSETEVAPPSTPNLASSVFTPSKVEVDPPERKPPLGGRWRLPALVGLLICLGLAYWFRPAPRPFKYSLPPASNDIIVARETLPPENPESNVISIKPSLPATAPVINTPGPLAGLLDASFDPGLGPDGDISDLAVQPDGGILVAGHFYSFNGVTRRGLVRLAKNGNLEAQNADIEGTVNVITEQADGHIMIAGEFNMVHSMFRPRLARLEANLALDPMFYAGESPNGEVFSMAMADNKIFIGGAFDHVGEASLAHLARLDAGGHIDPSFLTCPVDGPIFAMAPLPDGNTLIGGNFFHVHGAARGYLCALAADGKLDRIFRRDIKGGPVRAIVLQRDGKVLLGGDFTALHNASFKGIVRLTANGGVDNGFSPGSGANGSITTIAVQRDGKILVGGDFTSFNGFPRDHLARLHPDGSLDPAFSPKITGDDVRKVLVQTDGRILVAGRFTSVEGVSRVKLARLMSSLSSK